MIDCVIHEIHQYTMCRCMMCCCCCLVLVCANTPRQNLCEVLMSPSKGAPDPVRCRCTKTLRTKNTMLPISRIRNWSKTKPFFTAGVEDAAKAKPALRSALAWPPSW